MTDITDRMSDMTKSIHVLKNTPPNRTKQKMTEGNKQKCDPSIGPIEIHSSRIPSQNFPWVPQTTQGLCIVGKIMQQMLEDCAMQQ